MDWEEARRSLYPLEQWGGFTTERVPLDWLRQDASCMACGDPAATAYRGRAFHAICAIELAVYVMLVKRGERTPIALPSGLSLDAGAGETLELPVGR